MKQIQGLHHITCIAGPAQENLDFYSGALGLRLVKRSVNQDDPGTYHLFYADSEGHAGTDLTFFPWSQMAPSRKGHGLSTEVSLAIPPGSLSYWQERLGELGVTLGEMEARFSQPVLPMRDPHGLSIALVESNDSLGRTFSAWPDSSVPEQHQIRGLESARLLERDLTLTTSFLEQAMGFKFIGREGEWHRYGVANGKSGAYLELAEAPAAPRGAWGTGSVHHLAWRMEDDAQENEMRDRVIAYGAHPSPVIDRFWFKSVYFKEPGGVLFELATDGPGFGVDEEMATLGQALVLPPWLELERRAIEQNLPQLKMPAPRK